MADNNATQEVLLQTSRFGVEIDGVVVGLFKSCGGLESTSEVIQYKSVGPKGQLFTQKVAGHATYGDITLKSSLGGASALWDWRQLVEDGKFSEFRKDGSVILYDELGDVRDTYKFTAGWPSSWKINELDAGADDIVVQEVTIAHEGLTRKS